MEWISIEDKLPEPQKYILFYDKYGKTYVGWRIEDNNFAYDHGIIISCVVTHWMPLPEPPGCKKPCPLCDGHHGCDNCYYGQIDSKEPNEHCEDCEHNSDKVPTEWTSLGDTYCRKCGRKLTTPKRQDITS